MDQNNKYIQIFMNWSDYNAIFVGHVQYYYYYYYYIAEFCRTYCGAQQFINVAYIYECIIRIPLKRICINMCAVYTITAANSPPQLIVVRYCSVHTYIYILLFWVQRFAKKRKYLSLLPICCIRLYIYIMFIGARLFLHRGAGYICSISPPSRTVAIRPKFLGRGR